MELVPGGSKHFDISKTYFSIALMPNVCYAEGIMILVGQTTSWTAPLVTPSQKVLAKSFTVCLVGQFDFQK